jgi:hypothetical protein
LLSPSLFLLFFDRPDPHTLTLVLGCIRSPGLSRNPPPDLFESRGAAQGDDGRAREAAELERAFGERPAYGQQQRIEGEGEGNDDDGGEECCGGRSRGCRCRWRSSKWWLGRVGSRRSSWREVKRRTSLLLLLLHLASSMGEGRARLTSPSPVSP